MCKASAPPPLPKLPEYARERQPQHGDLAAEAQLREQLRSGGDGRETILTSPSGATGAMVLGAPGALGSEEGARYGYGPDGAGGGEAAVVGERIRTPEFAMRPVRLGPVVAERPVGHPAPAPSSRDRKRSKPGTTAPQTTLAKTPAKTEDPGVPTKQKTGGAPSTALPDTKTPPATTTPPASTTPSKTTAPAAPKAPASTSSGSKKSSSSSKKSSSSSSKKTTTTKTTASNTKAGSTAPKSTPSSTKTSTTTKTSSPSSSSKTTTSKTTTKKPVAKK